MTKIEKLIKRIESNPIKKDITFKELEKYLNHYGFYQRQQIGSHKQFKHLASGLAMTIVVKNKNVITVPYIKDAIMRISQVKENEDE